MLEITSEQRLPNNRCVYESRTAIVSDPNRPDKIFHDHDDHQVHELRQLYVIMRNNFDTRPESLDVIRFIIRAPTEGGSLSIMNPGPEHLGGGRAKNIIP